MLPRFLFSPGQREHFLAGGKFDQLNEIEAIILPSLDLSDLDPGFVHGDDPDASVDRGEADAAKNFSGAFLFHFQSWLG